MIIIGDVHGCYKELIDLMNNLPQTDKLCFVGDLIDRGPDSKKVIDLIIKHNYLSVLGNHEDMMLNDWSLWMVNGGKKTLESFNTTIYEFEKDMKKYLEWIFNLPLLIEYKNYLISHSFAYNGDETDPSDVLWGRSFNKNNCDKINIFGHTPVKKAQKIHNKHWNIDTGCFYTKKLTAIDLTTEKVYTN